MSNCWLMVPMGDCCEGWMSVNGAPEPKKKMEAAGLRMSSAPVNRIIEP